MGDLVGDHLLEWLLNRLQYNLTVLGVQHIEETTGNVETLLGGEESWQLLLHGLSEPLDLLDVFL